MVDATTYCMNTMFIVRDLADSGYVAIGNMVIPTLATEVFIGEDNDSHVELFDTYTMNMEYYMYDNCFI